MKSVCRRKTGRTNDPNYKKTHCANYHPMEDGASHAGLAQPPALPSPVHSPGTGTLLWPPCPAPHSVWGPATSPSLPALQEQRWCFASCSFAAARHFSGTEAAVLSFPPPFLAWGRLCSAAAARAPNVVMPVESKPGCLL